MTNFAGMGSGEAIGSQAVKRATTGAASSLPRTATGMIGTPAATAAATRYCAANSRNR